MRIDGHHGQRQHHLLVLHQSLPRQSHSFCRSTGPHPHCCSHHWPCLIGSRLQCTLNLQWENSLLHWEVVFGETWTRSVSRNSLIVDSAISRQDPVSSGLLEWSTDTVGYDLETQVVLVHSSLTACNGPWLAWRAVILAWTWKWAIWTVVWAIWTLTVQHVRQVGKMFLEMGKFMRIVTGYPAGRVQGQHQGGRCVNATLCKPSRPSFY